jgi:hypothetical protein
MQQEYTAVFTEPMVYKSNCDKYDIIFNVRGRSSLGRTSRLHREGRGFESPRLHITSKIPSRIY